MNDKEVPWFRHDMNARRDQNMVSLRYVYGAEGIGRFWILIEILREQSEYRLELTKWTIGMLADEWGCKKEDAETFLCSLVNDFHLCKKSDTYIWSESLCRRMIAFDERRKALSEAGHRGYQAKLTKSDSQAQATYKKRSSNGLEGIEGKEGNRGQAPSLSAPPQTKTKNPQPPRKPQFPEKDREMIIELMEIHKKATGVSLTISDEEMTDLLRIFRQHDGAKVVAAYQICQKEKPGKPFRFFLDDFAMYFVKIEKIDENKCPECRVDLRRYAHAPSCSKKNAPPAEDVAFPEASA